MKRTQLLVAAMGLAITTQAQRTAGTSIEFDIPVDLLEKTPTDTIFAGGLGAGLQLLQANSGYVSGVNDYGDLSKAQEFQLTAGTVVEELLIWFGAGSFDSNDPNSAIIARLYALDGPGTISTGATMGAPGTIYDEVIVPMSQVDTGGTFADVTVAQFASPVWVPSGFAAGVSFENTAAGDTLGIVHSTNGFVGAFDRSWEEWNDNSWHSIQSAWQQIAFDLAIFVVVDSTSVGIGEAGSFNGMRMSFLNGNPAATDDVLIGFEVESTSRMEFVVHNAKGEQLLVQDLGQRGLGVQQVSFSTAGWADGVYYCTLKADGRPLTKKLVVRR